MSERLYLSRFHILAELSLSEQMDGRRHRGRETRPDVPRLPSEVQLSEGTEGEQARRGEEPREKPPSQARR